MWKIENRIKELATNIADVFKLQSVYKSEFLSED